MLAHATASPEIAEFIRIISPTNCWRLQIYCQAAIVKLSLPGLLSPLSMQRNERIMRCLEAGSRNELVCIWLYHETHRQMLS